MTRWLDQACKAVEAVIALLLAGRVVLMFGNVVRGAAEPLVSARDGLKNLRLAEAIAQAATPGRVIEIPRY